MTSSAVPAALLSPGSLQPVPVPPASPAAVDEASSRYQVRAVQWGHRSRFEVRDADTDTTLSIASTRRIADEDVLVLNLAGPTARTLRAFADPAAESTPSRHGGPTQCARCRQVFTVDPAVDPTVLEDWWLCAPCRSALIGPASKPNSR